MLRMIIILAVLCLAKYINLVSADKPARLLHTTIETARFNGKCTHSFYAEDKLNTSSEWCSLAVTSGSKQFLINVNPLKILSIKQTKNIPMGILHTSGLDTDGFVEFRHKNHEKIERMGIKNKLSFFKSDSRNRSSCILWPFNGFDGFTMPADRNVYGLGVLGTRLCWFRTTLRNSVGSELTDDKSKIEGSLEAENFLREDPSAGKPTNIVVGTETSIIAPPGVDLQQIMALAFRIHKTSFPYTIGRLFLFDAASNLLITTVYLKVNDHYELKPGQVEMPLGWTVQLGSSWGKVLGPIVHSASALDLSQNLKSSVYDEEDKLTLEDNAGKKFVAKKVFGNSDVKNASIVATNLVRDFKLSFIEAFSIYHDEACFSQGLLRNSAEPIRCIRFNSGHLTTDATTTSRLAPMLPADLRSKQEGKRSKYAVQAFSVYDHDSNIVFDIVFTRVEQTRAGPTDKPQVEPEINMYNYDNTTSKMEMLTFSAPLYYHCVVSHNSSTNPLAEFPSSTSQCKAARPIAQAPSDIIAWEPHGTCNLRVVAIFGSTGVTVLDAEADLVDSLADKFEGRKLSELQSIMQAPNAVFALNQTFYFFVGANTLVSADASVGQDGCKDIEFRNEKTVLASAALLLFDDQSFVLDQIGRYTGHASCADDVVGGADCSLDEAKLPLPDKGLLMPLDFEFPAKIGARSPHRSAMTLLLILIIVSVVIFSCAVYYFCCSSSPATKLPRSKKSLSSSAQKRLLSNQNKRIQLTVLPKPLSPKLGQKSSVKPEGRHKPQPSAAVAEPALVVMKSPRSKISTEHDQLSKSSLARQSAGVGGGSQLSASGRSEADIGRSRISQASVGSVLSRHSKLLHANPQSSIKSTASAGIAAARSLSATSSSSGVKTTPLAFTTGTNKTATK